MKKTFIIFFLFISTCVFSQYSKADPHEYGLHFVVGQLISGTTTLIVNDIIKRPVLSSIIGFGVGTLTGIGKELIWDKKLHHAACTTGDMIATSLGALNFSLIFDLTIFYRNRHER